MAQSLAPLVSVLEHPEILRAWLKSQVFSRRCFLLTKALKCHQSTFHTILDVGANIGQFACAAAFHFPGAHIHSFEPLPHEFAQLQKNTRRGLRVTPYHIALGNESGKLPFYVNQYSRLSSVRPIDPANDHPRYCERKTCLAEVDVVRLDELGDSLRLEPPVLLKMDVQGMEKEVLLGAGELLKKVDFILCEVALVTLYAGQPLFDEMHSLLRDLEFRLVAPLHLNEGKGGRVIEMDVLYGRRS